MTIKDVRGIEVQIQDTVVFGENNGSTLYTGKVFKVTPKLVFIRREGTTLEYRRYPERVAILEICQ